MQNIIDSFINHINPVEHQIESYNWYVEKAIPIVLEEFKDSIDLVTGSGVKHAVQILNPRVGGVRELDTQLYELVHLINCKLNLEAAVFVDLHYTVTNKAGVLIKTEKIPDFVLCHIPVMIGSNLRENVDKESKWVDRGGYFIYNGNEKTILIQEKMSNNKPIVSIIKQGNKNVTVCELRSLPCESFRSTSTIRMFYHDEKFFKLRKDPSITVSIPYIDKNNVSLFTCFNLVGIWAISEMVQRVMMWCTDQSIHSLIASYATQVLVTADAAATYTRDYPALVEHIFTHYLTPKTAAHHATKQDKIHFIKHKIFSNEFLIHLGAATFPCTLRQDYVGLLAFELLTVSLNTRFPDSRDNYASKRLHTNGMLLALQFRQLMRRFSIQSKLAFSNKFATSKGDINIRSILNTSAFTNGMRYALSTGKWGLAKGASSQEGVSQLHCRLNIQSSLSHLRRVNSQFSRDGKSAGPRQLHGSHYGILCAFETPDGKSCGLIKALAITTKIRASNDSSILNRFLTRNHALDLIDYTTSSLQQRVSGVKIFINGKPSLVTRDHVDVAELLREWRSKKRAGDIPSDTSIIHDSVKKVIHLKNDDGCATRPLIYLRDFDVMVTMCKQIIPRIHSLRTNTLFLYLRSLGLIEYIDKEEEVFSDTRIAIDLGFIKTHPQVSFTHLELSNLSMMGFVALLLPFSDHNQAPRNIYSTVQFKQAYSKQGLSQIDRLASNSASQAYLEKPIVQTRSMPWISYDKFPSGQNVKLAIMSWTYNQEDSIIMDQSSIDNGLFLTFLTQVTSIEESTDSGNAEFICNPLSLPKEQIVLQKTNYRHLDAKGIVKKGSILKYGDIILGKVSIIGGANRENKKLREAEEKKKNHKQHSKVRYHCNSVRNTIQGVVLVDKVETVKNASGFRIIKIRTLVPRVPERGDKFCGTCAQKGTIGMTCPREDLPFSAADGSTPDIIINPHAIPSRMTVGFLLELLCGKAGAISGRFVDGTPFTEIDNLTIEDILKKYNFNPNGTERYYDGRSGQMLTAHIFSGMIYYERLKYNAQDKIHARERGPKQLLTGQPLEGRARNGGLRFGEMERDACVAHGASHLLKDRLCESSDAFEAKVCITCQLFVSKDKARCFNCKSSSHLFSTTIPFAFKLLVQELQTCGIQTVLEF